MSDNEPIDLIDSFPADSDTYDALVKLKLVHAPRRGMACVGDNLFVAARTICGTSPRQVLRARRAPRTSAARGSLAVAEVSQTANGLRVKMHDKHGPLVSIGRYLGMFDDKVQVRAQYAISDKPMTAEEWKRQHVKPG